MHTIEFEFTYTERIEGASIFEVDGVATITSQSGRRDDPDWMITKVSVDGRAPNPRRLREPDGMTAGPMFVDVLVDLPERHPLHSKIMIDLLQGYHRHEIAYEWERQRLVQREEAAA